MQIYFCQKWEEGNKLWKINSKLTEMRLVPKFRETLILNWRNAVSNKFNVTRHYFYLAQFFDEKFIRLQI